MRCFYARCSIEGKTCLVGFDYGSLGNVVSQRLVDKLHLPTSHHFGKAKVHFTIGRYEDEVTCEVSPMETCHLLLGWSWLQSKKLNHDKLSLYLKHEGNKLILKFLTPNQVLKDQGMLKEKIEKEKEVENKEKNELNSDILSSSKGDLISHRKEDETIKESSPNSPSLKRKHVDIFPSSSLIIQPTFLHQNHEKNENQQMEFLGLICVNDDFDHFQEIEDHILLIYETKFLGVSKEKNFVMNFKFGILLMVVLEDLFLMEPIIFIIGKKMLFIFDPGGALIRGRILSKREGMMNNKRRQIKMHSKKKIS